MKLNLRYLLTVAFTVIATVPVLSLGFWVEETAMDKELAAVSEKHLLLARNMTAAFDRYAEDAKAVFSLFAEDLGGDKPATAISLAQQMGFRHVCIIEDDGHVIANLKVTDEIGKRFPPEVLRRLRPQFGNDTAIFSDVMADGKGRPTIYLTMRLVSGRIAIAAIDLAYIRRMQKAITFGRKGHAAVVDRSGNVIAHPKAEWQQQMKNLAKVKPVTRMLVGDTGVTTFYAPVLDKEMITGYTTVPATGWGVMVPQPMEELEARAGDVKRVALSLIFVGLVTAALISWILSGLLVRPVEAVLRVARDIAEGNLDSRVPALSKVSPSEFHELGTGFNEMAHEIKLGIVERELAKENLRQTNDQLEIRVRARTDELRKEAAERTRAEEKHRESENRFRDLIEGSIEGIMIHSNFKALFVNRAFAKIFGFESPDEILALDTVLELAPPHEAERFKRYAAARMRGEDTPIAYEYEGLKKDGSTIWLDNLVRQVSWRGASAIQSTVVEITDRKRAQRDLHRLATAIEELDVNFGLYDVADRLIMTNQNNRDLNQAVVETMTPGVTFEEHIRAAVAEGLVPQAVGREEEWLEERLESHRNPCHPFELQRQDGTWLLVHEQRLPDGSTITIGTDITWRKQIETALRESEERHRQFAADAAHELRTPLAVLRSNLDTIEDAAAAVSLREDVDAITRLVEQLLALTKLDVLEIDSSDEADLREVCTNVATYLAPLALREKRSIQVTGTKIPVIIRGNATSLEQAVRNLAENSLRYSRRGSTVSLKIGNDATISVIDNGPGIPREQQNEIFDRFVRADRRSGGAGLGLSIVRRIVDAHNGRIEISDTSGGGATFTMHFPVADSTLQ